MKTLDQYGICIVEDLNDLDNTTVKNIVETKRKEGFPCFLFFKHEWETRSKQIIEHISSYQTEKKRIYARDCTVKKIELRELRKFCNNHHIQGSNNLGIAGWALYYEDEVTGVLSLGRHHRQNAPGVLLDRLCFLSGVRVVGGASKLFSKAIAWAIENGIENIISFSDNRWSIGTVYPKLGFKLDKEMPPDYLYISKQDFNQYFSKQSQKKSNTNCPDGLTEKQWAEKRGLIQVYDAGKKRWTYKVSLRRNIRSYSHRSQGYYVTKKAGTIYYQSSYELRAATLLDEMDEIETYSTQVRFIKNGKERYIDFFVKRKDGTYCVIEIKPQRRVKACSDQINAHKSYAEHKGWEFVIWSENELGFKTEHEAKIWADNFLSQITSIDYNEERRKRNTEKVKTYYQKKIKTDKVNIYCDFCQKTHEVLRKSYEKNVDYNKRYICEREGGYIAGRKPGKKKINPYAAEGKKQCNRCKDVKLFGDFSPDKTKTDGYSTRCKTCRAEVYKKRYHERKNK